MRYLGDGRKTPRYSGKIPPTPRRPLFNRVLGLAGGVQATDAEALPRLATTPVGPRRLA